MISVWLLFCFGIISICCYFRLSSANLNSLDFVISYSSFCVQNASISFPFCVQRLTFFIGNYSIFFVLFYKMKGKTRTDSIAKQKLFFQNLLKTFDLFVNVDLKTRPFSHSKIKIYQKFYRENAIRWSMSETAKDSLLLSISMAYQILPSLFVSFCLSCAVFCIFWLHSMQ